MKPIYEAGDMVTVKPEEVLSLDEGIPNDRRFRDLKKIIQKQQVVHVVKIELLPDGKYSYGIETGNGKRYDGICEKALLRAGGQLCHAWTAI